MSARGSLAAHGTARPAVAAELPPPALEGGLSLERVLALRRSVRSFAASPLTLSEVARLLWAAQGLTHEDDGRTAPSAGGLHPLRALLVAERVEGLAPGVHAYEPAGHRLIQRHAGPALADLGAAAWKQSCVAGAAAALVVAAVYETTTDRYGERGIRYVHLEAGHALENAHLEATALGLGAVVVGAFEDDAVARVLRARPGERPLGMLAVGRRR